MGRAPYNFAKEEGGGGLFRVLEDFVVLSKYCKMCEIWSKRDSSSPEFLKWKKNHEDSCSLNFNKS